MVVIGNHIALYLIDRLRNDPKATDFDLEVIDHLRHAVYSTALDEPLKPVADVMHDTFVGEWPDHA